MTSGGSAELIAVSSLCTYDIYRTYINPKATGKQILRASRFAILAFGCIMGALAAILNMVGVSLGWMYLAMKIVIGSAFIPIASLLLWKKANASGAIAGLITGCILGIITWLTVTKVVYGQLNLATTGMTVPTLAGNCVAILSSGVIHIVSSLLWPQNFDWESTKQITMVEKDVSDLPDDEFKEEKLKTAKAWILKWSICFTVVILLLWPVLSLPASKFICDLISLVDLDTWTNSQWAFKTFLYYVGLFN